MTPDMCATPTEHRRGAVCLALSLTLSLWCRTQGWKFVSVSVCVSCSGPRTVVLQEQDDLPVVAGGGDALLGPLESRHLINHSQAPGAPLDYAGNAQSSCLFGFFMTASFLVRCSIRFL